MKFTKEYCGFCQEYTEHETYDTELLIAKYCNKCNRLISKEWKEKNTIPPSVKEEK